MFPLTVTLACFFLHMMTLYLFMIKSNCLTLVIHLWTRPLFCRARVKSLLTRTNVQSLHMLKLTQFIFRFVTQSTINWANVTRGSSYDTKYDHKRARINVILLNFIMILEPLS